VDSGQVTKGRDPDLIASRGQCDHEQGAVTAPPKRPTEAKEFLKWNT